MEADPPSPLAAAAHECAKRVERAETVTIAFLKDTVSFSQLGGVAGRLSKADAARLRLGTVDGALVATLAHEEPTAPAPAPAPARSKKRRRDAEAEEVELHVHKLSEASTASPELLATAKTAVTKLLALRSVEGAKVVDAWGLSAAAPGDARPALILSLRLVPNQAVLLSAMRDALGACFKDGLVTVTVGLHQKGYELPLSAATRLLEESGQRSLLVFATVAD